MDWWIEQSCCRIFGFIEKNIEFCINTSLENGYPLDLIFKTINHRIKNINNRLNCNNIHKENEQIVNQKRYSFLPISIINNLFKTTKSVIDKSRVSIGYYCLNQLSRFISSYADGTKLPDKNNVIRYENCDTDFM